MDPIRLALLIGTVCLPGCGGADASADGADTAAVIPADAAPADTAETDVDEVFTPDVERPALPSDRIYFTLTDYEWYARGEPLVHDDLAWVPAGLVAAPVSEMTHEGEYGGVWFYRRDDEEQPALYVPVFRGWWQEFRADSTRAIPAAPARDAMAAPR